MTPSLAYLGCFFLLFLFVFFFVTRVIKPLLAARLASHPPADYENWFVTTAAPGALKITADLSRFVRNKYPQQSANSPPCQAYLHVFAHTSAGKPLALLFDNQDAITASRYLDDPLDPGKWRYRQTIDNRCIEAIDNWRDYFIKVQANENDDNTQPTASHKSEKAMVTSPLSHVDRQILSDSAVRLKRRADCPLDTLSSRYRYTIDYRREQKHGDTTARRYLVIRFSDVISARSWDFELTGISWTPLRDYADKSRDGDDLKNDNAENSSPDYRQAIKRLQQLMPLCWLTRPDHHSPLKQNPADAGSLNHPIDPCWSEAHGRAVIGKRAVTLQAFYYHYLRGLQQPSKDEIHATSITQVLQRMYFDCRYDKASTPAVTRASPGNRKPTIAEGMSKPNKNSPNQAVTRLTPADKKNLDAVLYPVVPFLRLCPGNKKFDPLLQHCQ